MTGTRIATLLSALAAALAVAFVLAPGMVAASWSGGGYSDAHDLRDALGVAFVEYWRSGERDFTPGLQDLVDYWFRYHVVKAVIAALLLIVLVALGALLWKAFLRAGGLGRGRRVALASGSILVTMLALSSVALLMANIQGAVAPFSALLPMLPSDANGDLGATLDQVRQRLADTQGTGNPPPLDAMISDFGWYHVAMAVIAATVAVVFIALSVLSWRSFTRNPDRRTKRVVGSFGVLSALLSLGLIVVVIANITVAADPAPALAAFFHGGW